MSGPLRYDQFVEDALRTVVRRTLKTVREAGLPGNHHLYITFATTHPGVDIAPHLTAQYPEEMTIVLQHQFWGLDVEEDRFAVTLSFNKLQERLDIPFAAITAFADPSVNFGLQFKSNRGEPARSGRGGIAELPATGSDAPVRLADTKPTPAEDEADGDESGTDSGTDPGGDDKVVTLDAFRKK